MGEIKPASPAFLPPAQGALSSTPLPQTGGVGDGPVSTKPAPRPFWEQPLASLDRGQWEALCDGCGKCCLHKLEDEDTGAYYETNVACTLLDLTTARCKDYPRRRKIVPDCMRLTADIAGTLGWLPATCAYRRRAEDLPLPDWHYLVSGDRDAVHRAGASVIGKAISEDIAGPLEQHIVWSGDDHGEVVYGPEADDDEGDPGA